MGFWPVVLNVIKNSDVVLLLVDARMPEISMNTEIVKKVEERKRRIIVVFNKVDLVSEKELENLKERYVNAYFTCGKKLKTVKGLREHLENLAENWERSSLRIGIVGYPNVGKSSLINILAPHARAKVKGVSGTTRKTQWIRTGKLRIMDSPGVIPFEDKNVRIGMASAKDPHKLKHPEKVAMKIVDYLDGKEACVLNKFYGVDKNLEGYDLFLAIGKKKGFLIRGHEVVT